MNIMNLMKHFTGHDDFKKKNMFFFFETLCLGAFDVHFASLCSLSSLYALQKRLCFVFSFYLMNIMKDYEAGEFKPFFCERRLGSMDFMKQIVLRSS